MTDILKRLRRKTGDGYGCTYCHEAADEIERLRNKVAALLP